MMTIIVIAKLGMKKVSFKERKSSHISFTHGIISFNPIANYGKTDNAPIYIYLYHRKVSRKNVSNVNMCRPIVIFLQNTLAVGICKLIHLFFLFLMMLGYCKFYLFKCYNFSFSYDFVSFYSKICSSYSIF